MHRTRAVVTISTCLSIMGSSVLAGCPGAAAAAPAHPDRVAGFADQLRHAGHPTGRMASAFEPSSRGSVVSSTTVRGGQPGAALTLLGQPRSGQSWFSGTWTGGAMGSKGINAFSRWRGAPVDAVLTYPERRTYADIARSEWHIATFDGVPGRLIYGLPLLPENGSGTFGQVAAGRHDQVWSKVARDLVKHKRGNSVVRIGWEANGDSWFAWGATASTAAGYRSAYRHVVKVMRRTAPHLRFDFDITCGHGLTGSGHRLAPLSRLYPGDDSVDIVGCDNYNSWTLRATDQAQWARTVRPKYGPGLADVARFARAHHKGLSIPEWGVISRRGMGNGDNPFYIRRMHGFMVSNRDIMTFEAYFNDTTAGVGSSLWRGNRNPRSAAVYRRLWGR